MPQCEMCGADAASPKTVTVESAELQVCDNCADFGTEVATEESTASSSKYSTDSSSSGQSSSTSSSSTGGSSRSHRGSDMYDEMDELVQDYDERIRAAREESDQSQEELASSLNEKASLIRKLERGDVLPSSEVQTKLERALDIAISGDASADSSEWNSENSGDGLTLGDMVKRTD